MQKSRQEANSFVFLPENGGSSRSIQPPELLLICITEKINSKFYLISVKMDKTSNNENTYNINNDNNDNRNTFKHCYIHNIYII